MNRLWLLALAPLAFSKPALAVNGPNLSTTLTPPAGVSVYQNGLYTVTVSNIGNRNASSASLTIRLPVTGTSPQTYVFGIVGSMSSTCTRSGATITCALGAIARNTSRTVTFNLALPYSTRTPGLQITATAATAGDTNPANDSATHYATPATYNVAVNAPRTTLNRHCTGQNVLTSFYECELFPSSIASHSIVLNADNTISIPGQPTFSGSWSQAGPDQLHLEYYNNGNLAATFDGRGVGPSGGPFAARGECFEGKTVFPPPSVYISMYQVCLQP